MELPPTGLSQPSANFWRSKFILHRSRFASLLLLLVTGGAGAEVISSRHWALFNTTCARCHEAQCSGRMSLGSEDANSRAHVERYAGVLSDNVHQQLFLYLQHMKEFCGFAAIPHVFEPRAAWSETQLELFRTPNGEAYFVPLGELGAGSHRLQARLIGTGWTAQVVSAGFDTLAEAVSCGSGEGLSLDFRAGDGMHYLRVTGRGALHLQELRLVAAPM